MISTKNQREALFEKTIDDDIIVKKKQKKKKGLTETALDFD